MGRVSDSDQIEHHLLNISEWRLHFPSVSVFFSEIEIWRALFLTVSAKNCHHSSKWILKMLKIISLQNSKAANGSLESSPIPLSREQPQTFTNDVLIPALSLKPQNYSFTREESVLRKMRNWDKGIPVIAFLPVIWIGRIDASLVCSSWVKNFYISPP